MGLIKNLKNIFEYSDYRKYLKDYYEFQKQTNGLTHRQFSEQAGFKSSVWLSHLISGQKNLTEKYTNNISDALLISEDQKHFFRILVKFNQAKTNQEKNHLYKKILSIKKKLASKLNATRIDITEKIYEYYNKWYHPVIRSLITKFDFKEDFALLGRACLPAITPKEARASVRLLEKLELIELLPNGTWTQTIKVIATAKEVTSLNVINYHKQTSVLAQDIYDRCQREAREISALTLGIDQNTFETIKMRIRAFSDELTELVRNSPEPDRVYQLNFQFFPVSRIKGVTQS